MSPASWFRTLFLVILASVLLLGSPSFVLAQKEEKVGPFVVDLHGSMVRYGQDEALAASRKVIAAQLPSWGLGLDVGAHWYPMRLKVITLGVGLQLLTSKGRHTLTSDDGQPIANEVLTRFTVISPQLSFNFGHKRGWSYLSGGLSRGTLTVTDLEADPGDRVKVLNYGGGARWFIKRHVGFSFDVRFYGISPRAATDERPGNPRMTWVALSAGISVQ